MKARFANILYFQVGEYAALRFTIYRAGRGGEKSSRWMDDILAAKHVPV